MNIGQAATASGVTPKMIRHYESLGLLPRVARSGSGYRIYDDRALHTLRFIRRAREMGFGLDEIAALLTLWGNRRRASAEVKALAARHVAALQARIERMQAMQRTLQQLVDACHGDGRPDCPILDDLAGGAADTPPPDPAPRSGRGAISASGFAAPCSARPAARRHARPAAAARRG
ncbi:MAG: Cu(I)-responsive transcriptional regulator [Burkholderiales bacterium]|nr:Cu(I)-responsive transcriptional regulator [Burkholderiales bacterium]